MKILEGPRGGLCGDGDPGAAPLDGPVPKPRYGSGGNAEVFHDLERSESGIEGSEKTAAVLLPAELCHAELAAGDGAERTVQPLRADNAFEMAPGREEGRVRTEIIVTHGNGACRIEFNDAMHIEGGAIEDCDNVADAEGIEQDGF